MPSTFGEVAALLTQAVQKSEAAISTLSRASALVDECRSQLLAALAGTTAEDDAAAVIASFQAVQDGVAERVRELRAALEGLARIRARFEVHSRPEPASPAAVQSWVAGTRAGLPWYRTSGVYRSSDGRTDLVQSGREPDGEHDRINDHLVDLGIGRPGASVEASKHVEVKVAWRMRQSGMNRVELVVNNELCNGVLSCSRLLPHVLGPGQTLTVHDPVRSREFRGKDVR
ncbi:DddA-like double-stranded DNA deaminase toxin [Lentzea sp. NPDC042327]|uniref:DddA-like double-stranded DNA deaminase toxin n=1 Tax=Lentzea sp. NPDC042327 TaxID=3154801 RepID=UPI0033EFE907